MSKKTSEWEELMKILDKYIYVSNGVKASAWPNYTASGEMYTAFKREILDWHTKQLAKEKMELVEEVVEFVNQNQDCGACNLDIEIKKYLEALKSEIQEKEEE